MYCPNCGKKVEDGSKFCYNCGASIEAPQTQKNADRISDNQKAISDRPQTVPAENNGAKASEEENGKKENPIITGIRIVVAVIFMVLVIGLFTGRFDDFFARITNGSMTDNTSKVVVDKNTGNVYSTAPATEAAVRADPSNKNSSTEKAKESTYSYAYGSVFDRLGDDEWGSYFLWDLNNDGIYELVIGHGSYGSDYVNDFYTLDDDGKALKVGQLEAEWTFLTTPDGNGIYAARELKNYERVYRITMTGNSLISNVYIDRPLEEDEQYYSVINDDDVIETTNIKDRSLLSEYNKVKVSGKSKK